LAKNEKDELFKNSIQAYVQYPKELKQKGKKVAMKMTYDAWRSYKSKLVNIWRNQDTPFRKYKDVTKEDWVRFIEKCGSDHTTSLTTTLATLVMLENRGSGNKRMKDWPSKVLRIYMTNSVDG
jgi:hypothetical protein